MAPPGVYKCLSSRQPNHHMCHNVRKQAYKKSREPRTRQNLDGFFGAEREFSPSRLVLDIATSK